MRVVRHRDGSTTVTMTRDEGRAFKEHARVQSNCVGEFDACYICRLVDAFGDWTPAAKLNKAWRAFDGRK